MWRSKRCRRTTARRGVDHVSTEQYGANLDVNLVRLGEALRTDSYRPQSIRRHDIPKHVLGPAFGRTRGPGSQEKRPLGIPTVQDRVVQTALRMVIEPIFERDFAAQSYGFRPGRGCKEALRRVDELLKMGIPFTDLAEGVTVMGWQPIDIRFAGQTIRGRFKRWRSGSAMTQHAGSIFAGYDGQTGLSVRIARRSGNLG